MQIGALSRLAILAIFAFVSVACRLILHSQPNSCPEGNCNPGFSDMTPDYDILFVVDNSGSMHEEQQNLGLNISSVGKYSQGAAHCVRGQPRGVISLLVREWFQCLASLSF